MPTPSRSPAGAARRKSSRTGSTPPEAAPPARRKPSAGKTSPAAAAKPANAGARRTPKPIDPNKAGAYVSGHWQYTLEISDPGTPAEGRSGWLLYDGQKLPRGQINDYLQHALGARSIGSTCRRRNGACTAGCRFRLAREPAGETLGIARRRGTAARRGRMVRNRQGATTANAPRCPSGNGCWSAWRQPHHGLPVADGRQSTASRCSLVAEPQYVATPVKPGVVGSGGRYYFKFRALQPGMTTIKLIYLRPWQKDQPPLETFRCTVEVLSPKPAVLPPHS